MFFASFCNFLFIYEYPKNTPKKKYKNVAFFQKTAIL